MLLNSVPNTYNHLISTLLYKNDSIKFDIVSNARLCSESKVVTIIKLVKISVSFVITRALKEILSSYIKNKDKVVMSIWT